jgi:hypothetical protein
MLQLVPVVAVLLLLLLRWAVPVLTDLAPML